MRRITFWLSLALIFSIPWETVVENPILGSASRIIGLFVAGAWIATIIMTGKIRKPNLFHAVVVLFVTWNALSAFWSQNVERTVSHLVTWSQLLILAYILWDQYKTRQSLMTGLQMYVLGAYVVVGNAVSNYLSGKTYYYERFSAAGTNPDDLGVVLALGIPVAWYLVAHNDHHKLSRWLKWINYAYVAAALFGIALSGTRTALIAAGPGLVYGLTSLTRLKPAAKIAIFLLLMVGAYILIPYIPQASFERLGSTLNELSKGDLNGRLALWSEGLTSFSEHPLLGVGSNMYRSVNSLSKVAHNSFLSVLVELGIVGFTLFAVILGIVVIQALRQSKWEASFWLFMLASWTIGAFTLTWEYRKPTWLFLSLIIVSSAISRQNSQDIPLVQQEKLPTQLMPQAHKKRLPHGI